MLSYAYTLHPDDNGTYLITFPDIPQAAAVADTPQTVAREAADGLLCALAGYFTDRQAVPPACFLFRCRRHNRHRSVGQRKNPAA